MSDHPQRLGFADYMANALTRAGDAEVDYQALLDGDDTARDRIMNAVADAANNLSLAGSAALDDAVALSRASRGEFAPSPLVPSLEVNDLWEVAAADTDPEPVSVDPQMEARAARDIAAADLLAAPAFDDVEVPGSLWSETAALEDRFFGDLLAGPEPQTEREDRTAREHDERTNDWNRAAEEDDQ